MKNKIFLILLMTALVSCLSEKDGYLREFGNFINETEANYESYSDEEWKATELKYLDFIRLKVDLKNDLDTIEKKQIRAFEKRFKNIQIRKDPLNHLMDIFK